MSIYEFTVKDAQGADVSLSEYRGKVLLIVNTATGCGFTPQYEEIESMYEKYHDKGFEIYQVGIESSKAVWVSAVQEQKLPWISVSDLQGTASTAVKMYNVQNVPTNFLIDREGNIVGKDLYGAELEKHVAALI